jgi:hypothetical protein
MGSWNCFAILAGRQLRNFFLNNIGAEINALITDENRWASNELLNFVLALAAKRAI